MRLGAAQGPAVDTWQPQVDCFTVMALRLCFNMLQYLPRLHGHCVARRSENSSGGFEVSAQVLGPLMVLLAVCLIGFVACAQTCWEQDNKTHDCERYTFFTVLIPHLADAGTPAPMLSPESIHCHNDRSECVQGALPVGRGMLLAGPCFAQLESIIAR